MWNNENPSLRFAIALLIGILTIITFGTISFFSLQRVIEEKDAAAFDYSQRLIETQALATAFEEKVAHSRGFFVSGNSDSLEDAAQARARFLDHLARLDRMLSSNRGREFLNSVRKKELDHERVLQAVIAKRKPPSQPPEFLVHYDSHLRPRRLVLKEEIENFVGYQSGLLEEARNQSNHQALFFKSLILVVAVLSALTLFCIALYLMRTLRRLALADRRFQDLVNHLDHSIVWEAEPNPFRFHFVSERSQFLLGISPSEFLRDSDLFFRHIVKEDRLQVEELLSNAGREGLDQRVEHRMLTVDGKEIWVQTGVHVRKDPKGKNQFYGITVDITQNKEQEQARLESQAKAFSSAELLEQVIHQMPAGISVTEAPSGRSLLQNSEVKRILGHEIIPRESIRDFAQYGAIHPDGTPYKPEDYPTARALLHDEVIRDEEMRYRRPDGSIALLSVSSSPIRNHEGKMVRVVSTFFDISERKNIEFQLRRALKDLGDFKYALDAAAIVAITDERGVITYVNDKFCEISKYSREELIGKTHKVVNSEYHSREFFQNLWRTISSGKVWRGQIRNKTKYGEFYWVDTFIVPFLSDNGKPYQYVSIRSDITEQKTAADTKSSLVERLQEEREMREKFVTMLTHDLRTPLSAVKVSAQMMARKVSNPEVVVTLSGRLIDSVNRMDRMIQDLLDTNRIKAGKTLLLQRTNCDLRKVVSATLDDLAMIHGERFMFTSENSIEGNWDCDGLRRVTENLAVNAVKYGAPHAPIRVSLKRDGNEVHLSVHNEGDPLSREEQEALFNQFARSAAAERSGKKGWGVGLTLVQGIAEAHGGSVEVESNENGTTFLVRLPADRNS